MSYTGSPFIVEVTTSATLLEDTTATGVRKCGRLIRNLGASSVFLGGADVSADTSAGWELAAGEDFPDTVSNGNIYAIAASGTVDVQVWEVIN